MNKFGIKIKYIPFDTFTFPDDYAWSLAFYKLCVLKHLSRENYDNICYLDTDVYVQNSFEHIWKECEQNVLLYDINHGLQVPNYNKICDEFSMFFGKKKYITHYGGEFFASSKKAAIEFSEKIEIVYNKMIETDFVTTMGDEFILSLAADQYKENIKNAGAYIYRFWTGRQFRLISTCYKYNEITILHIPTEKQRGMIDLYDSYIKKGVLPTNKIAWKKLSISLGPFMFNINDLKNRIMKKIKK